MSFFKEQEPKRRTTTLKSHDQNRHFKNRMTKMNQNEKYNKK